MTEKGEMLSPVIESMRNWGNQFMS
ncbi:hypothetical protein [Fictibacillus enclensis]